MEFVKPINGPDYRPGKPRLTYISLEDMKRGLTWGSSNDDTLTLACPEPGRLRYTLERDEKCLHVIQRPTMVPKRYLDHMDDCYESVLPGKPETIYMCSGDKAWTLVVDLCPPGTPPLVSIVAADTFVSLVARKISEIAATAWQAYYGNRDRLCDIAAEMMVDTSGLKCRYDPRNVPPGTMPPPLAELRSFKIKQAADYIQHAIDNPAKKAVTNYSGRIVLHLWWLRNKTNSKVEETCQNASNS